MAIIAYLLFAQGVTFFKFNSYYYNSLLLTQRKSTIEKKITKAKKNLLKMSQYEKPVQFSMHCILNTYHLNTLWRGEV